MDPIFQTPTQNISPHGFFGSPKGHKTPPGGRFDGGFSFYWTSLGPPVSAHIFTDGLIRYSLAFFITWCVPVYYFEWDVR